MRRRAAVFAVGLAVILCVAVSAQASVQVHATFTGDNIQGALWQDGNTPVDITSYIIGDKSNWQATKTADFTLASLPVSRTYQVLFRVNNLGPYGDSGNPAAFLAQLNISGYDYTTETRLSGSTGWKWAIDTGPTPADFNLLTWTAATEWPYGGTSASNGGNNIWTNVKGGPIAGISSGTSGANWIWADENGVDLGPAGSPDAKNWLWIKTDIEVPPVPEPATLVVWSLLGMGSWLGMRVWRRRRGGPVGRQPWSDENRNAIHNIIAHGAHR